MPLYPDPSRVKADQAPWSCAEIACEEPPWSPGGAGCKRRPAPGKARMAVGPEAVLSTLVLGVSSSPCRRCLGILLRGRGSWNLVEWLCPRSSLPAPGLGSLASVLLTMVPCTVFLLPLLLAVQSLQSASGAELPALQVRDDGKPAFLDSGADAVDTCSTRAICDLICKADFEVYPAYKCDQYCQDDIHHFWDVFDSYCRHDIRRVPRKFCGDLCHDAFYCKLSSCRKCHHVCTAEFEMVEEIFDRCADCDDRHDHSARHHETTAIATTTTTTSTKTCASNGPNKCQDVGCWCEEVCDFIHVSNCEERCTTNEAKVWPVLERYCECGFCNSEHPAEAEDAGLLQFRVQTATSDLGCGCRSEERYCFNLCRGLGYRGGELRECKDDCSSSRKLGGILEDYCTTCHKEYYKMADDHDRDDRRDSHASQDDRRHDRNWDDNPTDNHRREDTRKDGDDHGMHDDPRYHRKVPRRAGDESHWEDQGKGDDDEILDGRRDHRRAPWRARDESHWEDQGKGDDDEILDARRDHRRAPWRARDESHWEDQGKGDDDEIPDGRRGHRGAPQRARDESHGEDGGKGDDDKIPDGRGHRGAPQRARDESHGEDGGKGDGDHGVAPQHASDESHGDDQSEGEAPREPSRQLPVTAYPAPDMPHYWKLEALKGTDYFGENPTKPVPHYWKVTAIKSKDAVTTD